jgi:hypothetical protein
MSSDIICCKPKKIAFVPFVCIFLGWNFESQFFQVILSWDESKKTSFYLFAIKIAQNAGPQENSLRRLKFWEQVGPKDACCQKFALQFLKRPKGTLASLQNILLLILFLFSLKFDKNIFGWTTSLQCLSDPMHQPHHCAPLSYCIETDWLVLVSIYEENEKVFFGLCDKIKIPLVVIKLMLVKFAGTQTTNNSNNKNL